MTTGSIVLDVCREMYVLPEEFFGGCRRRDVTEARKLAIQRFKDAGFSMKGTARMMRVHLDTVRYWAHPHHRKMKLDRLERLKQERERVRRKLVMRKMAA